MPKDKYPQYEAMKEKFAKEGMDYDQAQERAAKISHTRGWKVPPSNVHKKSKGK